MNKTLIVTAIASMAISGMAFADTTFGNLAGATFGGTGNPTSPVEITTLAGVNGDTITLGLAAQQRYDNPAVTSPSAGVYLAGPGSDIKGTTPALGALWNFDFYANVAGTSGDNVSQYTFKLYYDFDPAAGTLKSALGVQNLTTAARTLNGGQPYTGSTIQDSENLLFPYLSTASLPLGVTPPAGSFDPNATGEYTFILEVDQDGRELGEESILVDVAGVPDVSATLPLLGAALTGLAMFGKRKNRA